MSFCTGTVECKCQTTKAERDEFEDRVCRNPHCAHDFGFHPQPQAADPGLRFKELLKAARIRPDVGVMMTITTSFALAASLCTTPPEAATLYDHAKAFPSSKTVAAIASQHGVNVNGPAYSGVHPNLLTASRVNSNEQLVIKILRAPGGENAHVHLLAIQRELEAVRVVAGAPPDLRLVHADPVTVEVAEGSDAALANVKPGRHHALLMRRYTSDWAHIPAISVAVLHTLAQGLESAVQWLHDQRIAHMDLKMENFFVAQDGSTDIGDFGSATSFDDTILTCTDVLLPFPVCGRPASPKYDWFMLTVAIVGKLLGPASLQQGGGHVVVDRLLSAVASIPDPLKSTLCAFLKRTEDLVAVEAILAVEGKDDS